MWVIIYLLLVYKKHDFTISFSFLSLTPECIKVYGHV